MPQMTYRGDRTGDYNHQSGTGTVGKVVEGLKGRWLVITEATYDAEADVTRCTTQQIRSPEQAFRAALEEKS